MSDRPRFPMNFGQGLDRETGSMAVEPSTYADLRNVHLGAGKAEIRQGNKIIVATPPTGTDAVLAFHPIRSQNITVVITLTTATRLVQLWLMANDGSTCTLIGTIWTLPVGFAFPKVVTADSYDLLFIAHDEATYANRMVTRYFDPVAVTINDLSVDLNRDTVAAAVKFRGVVKHLAYIFGWGYGSEVAGQGDRPEIVRCCVPQEPLNWQPEHYWLAGQRNEPVLACSPTGETLAVRKAQESYVIFGTDRATFGIKPLDTKHGAIAARLSMTLGGENYFWSLDGPRFADGGPSSDLAIPLAVQEAAVSGKATALTPTEGFVAYHAPRREIWFVFGQWAYVLNLKDENQKRWSYHEFDQDVNCMGLVYAGQVPHVYIGQRSSNVILESDATTFLDHGAYYYNLYAKTNRYAPAGAGGDAMFPAIYVTVSHFTQGEIYVTPIVDGIALERQKVVLAAAGGVKTTKVYEFAVSMPVTIGAVEVARVYGRGTWIQVLVETVNGAGSVGRVVIEQVEAEYEAIRESKLSGAIAA